MRPTLLISKLDDIKIVQVGESILTTKNNKQESTKIGFDKVATAIENKGKTTTVDLGKGAEKHRLKFFVFDRDENDAIFNTLRTKRYVKIIDKFKGKIEVFIDDYKIVDSDKHINKTVYELNCTVQDVEKIPTVNFTAKVKELIAGYDEKIASEVEDIAHNYIKTTDKIDDNFVDDMLNTIQDGINAVLDIMADVTGAYSQVKSRVDKARRLVKTLENITKFPQDLAKLLLDVTQETKIQSIEIFETEVGSKKLTEVEIEELSQIQQEEVERIEKANILVNLVTVSMEAKQALNTVFASQQEFEEHIGKTIKRLEYSGYTYDEVVERQHTMRAYANVQKYREIVEVEIKKSTPLTAVVYELYGNLENYDDIVSLNNFKDNDSVYGTVKVYDADSN